MSNVFLNYEKANTTCNMFQKKKKSITVNNVRSVVSISVINLYHMFFKLISPVRSQLDMSSFACKMYAPQGYFNKK